MNQYSAKLLFQWRPTKNGISRKRRVCEERIFTFFASSPELAYNKANKYGKDEQFEEIYEKSEVYFEFIGILELKEISSSYAEGEVWSEIKEMVSPDERKEKIVPTKEELDVFQKFSPNHKLKYRYK